MVAGVALFLALLAATAIGEVGVPDVFAPYDLQLLTRNVVPRSDRINGPSLVRVPAWLPASARPHMLQQGSGADIVAEWFLYYTDHAGGEMYLAWCPDQHLSEASDWVVFGTENGGSRKPVVTVTNYSLAHTAFQTQKELDAGSPDVFVEPVTQHLIMYFHAALDVRSLTRQGKLNYNRQATYVLYSKDGLTWVGKPQQPPLTKSYLRVFVEPDSQRLFGLSRGAALWRAPKRNPWTSTREENYITAWNVKRPGGDKELKDFALTFIGPDAFVNHLGLALLTPTVVEVTVGIKYMEHPKTRFGKILRFFFDISDRQWKRWHYVRDCYGQLLYQELVTQGDLLAPSGKDKITYPTDSDIYVDVHPNGTCTKYLTVAYGTARKGEGSLAMFRLQPTNEHQLPCLPNIHPAILELFE